jgi:signal transduction histidine kinase
MHRREITVTALLAAAHAAAQARYLEHGVRLERAVSATAAQARVDADPDRLAQVLTNLLDNALRHTPSGGQVNLTADRQGSTVAFLVADDGAGIAAEHLPHLFDRFYRVDTARDRAHGGSGIGLAVVGAIVRAHGGKVSASSAGPGQGATFTVTLPVTVCADGEDRRHGPDAEGDIEQDDCGKRQPNDRCHVHSSPSRPTLGHVAAAPDRRSTEKR